MMTLVKIFLLLIVNTGAMLRLEASSLYKVFCEVCGQGATSAPALADHMNKHTGAKPYVCEVCGQRFSSRPNIIRHMHQHSTDDDARRPFQCDLCPMRFTRSTGLKLHQTIHTGEKLYACEYEGCSKSFRQRGHRRTHYRKYHAGVLASSVALDAAEDDDEGVVGDQTSTGETETYEVREASTLLTAAVAAGAAQEDYGEAFAFEDFDNLVHSLPVPLADVAALKGCDTTGYVLAACQAGAYTIVEQWLDEGGNVDLQDQLDGMTLLMVAARYGAQSIVCMLLDAGADKTIKNKRGLTAYDLAKTRNIEILLAS